MSENSCRGYQNLFCVQWLFSKKKLCHFWDNVKKYGTTREATDDNIRRIRFAFWIPKATDTHSECVIHTAFPQQQWLCARASGLRYTYTACLVIFALHLQLYFSNGLFSSHLRTENCYVFLIVLTWPCCLPCPYRVPLFGHTRNVWWKVRILKLLIMQFSLPFNYTLLVPNVLLKVQRETMFLSREGISIASIPTYPPQTRNTRNPTASRKAEMVPSMVGQLSHSSTHKLSKTIFAVAFIRPERAECSLFIQVWPRERTKNCTVVNVPHIDHVKGG